jgi:hypothetical protein
MRFRACAFLIEFCVVSEMSALLHLSDISPADRGRERADGRALILFFNICCCCFDILRPQRMGLTTFRQFDSVKNDLEFCNFNYSGRCVETGVPCDVPPCYLLTVEVCLEKQYPNLSAGSPQSEMFVALFLNVRPWAPLSEGYIFGNIFRSNHHR